jgi:hypothetical protein
MLHAPTLVGFGLVCPLSLAQGIFGEILFLAKFSQEENKVYFF